MLVVVVLNELPFNDAAIAELLGSNKDHVLHILLEFNLGHLGVVPAIPTLECLGPCAVVLVGSFGGGCAGGHVDGAHGRCIRNALGRCG